MKRETQTATVSREAGFVLVRVRDGARQLLEHARENLGAAIECGAGTRCGLLIDIRRSEILDPAARHYYSGRQVSDAFSALALLVEANPVGRMMANVYLRIARLDLPSQIFSDEEKAKAWLESLA
jgi:hypothetical protein